MDEKKPERRKVNWRNVTLLVILGSPLLYLGDKYLPHLGNGPSLTSPEGRAIVSEAIRHFFPVIYEGGVRR